MASSRPSGSSLLEKWLEDVPSASSNSNVSVKRERNEFKDIFASSFSFNEPSFPLQSGHGAGRSASNQNVKSATATQPPPLPVKVEENQIDSSSINGLFGWEDVNDVTLPIIFREGERLVPVRIVEAKIIGKYSNVLPWTVFSCINIRSYFVTENEAALLNEINQVHCDFFFGYDPFTIKDVVVCLQDVFTLHKFLETSKDIFQLGLAKAQVEWLGFVNISGSFVVPYIGKSSNSTCSQPVEPSSTAVRKFVPNSLVQSHVLLVQVEKVEMTEWDASYLRMLLIYAGLEHLQIQARDSLCLLNDLKWDSALCALHIEECSPPVSTPNAPQSSHKLMNVAEQKPERTYHHHSSSSSSIPSQAMQQQPPVCHKQRSAPVVDRLAPPDDANWLLASANSNSPNPALRSLHQITRVEIGGISLHAINLKPYSTHQAVFVSDVVTKMFRGVSVLTAHYILEKILQVKLYECTRLHEDAFTRSGMRPLQGDKLVLVEVLRKCINQLRHIIMAGLTSSMGSSSSSASYAHHA